MSNPNLILLATEIKNPIEGVTPSFAALGMEFEGAVQIIIGIVWMAALTGAAVAMIVTGAQWAFASKVSHHEQSITAGSKNFQQAAAAFAVIALISVIAAAIVILAQRAGA